MVFFVLLEAFFFRLEVHFGALEHCGHCPHDPLCHPERGAHRTSTGEIGQASPPASCSILFPWLLPFNPRLEELASWRTTSWAWSSTTMSCAPGLAARPPSRCSPASSLRWVEACRSTEAVKTGVLSRWRVIFWVVEVPAFACQSWSIKALDLSELQSPSYPLFENKISMVQTTDPTIISCPARPSSHRGEFVGVWSFV